MERAKSQETEIQNLRATLKIMGGAVTIRDIKSRGESIGNLFKETAEVLIPAKLPDDWNFSGFHRTEKVGGVEFLVLDVQRLRRR